jgi:hypothetical protein
MSTLEQLLTAKNPITQFDYKTYQIFSSEAGAKYLREMLHTYAMEDPQTMSSTAMVWLDGRRSVWRDLQSSMDKVKHLLDGGHVNDNRTE